MEAVVEQLQPGTRVNNYQVERLLGKGAMGAAFLARDLHLGRPVVVKVMTGDAAEDPTLLERFRREAMAGALVDSEHVVKVFEAGRIAQAPSPLLHGKPFIAMQFVDGASISDVLMVHEGKLSAEAATLIALGLARGLAATHGAGIIHRDVKPANALLTHQGGVKLADLGLAKFLRGVNGAPPPPELTRPGTAVGTAYYIAPEQAMASPTTDGRADVYALGASYYELLTGQVPFEGPNYLDTVMLRFEKDPARPRTIDPNIPREVEEVCLAFLARDPEKRPTSAAAVSMLERLVPGERSAKLATLIADPRASTQADMPASIARRYGLEASSRPADPRASTVDAIAAKGPRLASTAVGAKTPPQPAPAQVPAPVLAPPPPQASALPAIFFAIGSFFLAAGAVAVALIVTRAPSTAPPAVVSMPSPPPAPSGPVPITRDTAPRALMDAIATRHAAKVRATSEAILGARFDGSSNLAEAGQDAGKLLSVLEAEAKASGVDFGLPLEKFLDALVAKTPTSKAHGDLSDETKAAAMLLAAVENQTVPPDLHLGSSETVAANERLERVLRALKLDRPTQR